MKKLEQMALAELQREQAAGDGAAPAAEEMLEELRREVMPVVKKVLDGERDPETLAEFKRRLPQTRALAARFGDLARVSTERAVESIPADELAQAAIGQHVANLRDELGYAKASALERGLIDHICLCWVRLWYAEHRYTMWTAKEWSYALGNARDWMLTAAQTRYLRAVEALARVRKLSARALQVNIGNKQINVAQMATGEVLEAFADAEAPILDGEATEVEEVTPRLPALPRQEPSPASREAKEGAGPEDDGGQG